MDKKRVFFSVFIFVNVLAILALPFFNWGFINDDCGFLWYSQLHKLSDLFSFFAPHDIGHAFNPSNYAAYPLTFGSVLYRPMQFVLFGLESWFLGINPYALLICVITLHALLSVALFNIYFTFFGPYFAFFGAMFFALHPSLEHWIGVFTCQIYIVDALYLLGSAYFLKRYLDTGRLAWYLLSCSIMTVSIFAKETLLVFPVWAFAATIFYFLFTQGGALWSHAGRAVRVSLGYWAGALFYLMVRVWLYPLQTVGGSFKQTLSVFIARQQERLGDWISYVCDYLYVGLVPSGNRLFKGSLVLVIISFFVWPFIARKQYKEFFFLAGSMALFTWPALLLYYQPRYLYVGLPFLFGIILYVLAFYSSRLKLSQCWVGVVLSLILVVNATGFFYRQRTKERVLCTITTAFKELVTNKKIYERAVLFIGLPMHWFGSGNAQALWLLGGGAQRMPVFYNIQTFAFKSEPFYEIKPHRMTVELKNEVVVLRSHDPEHLFFPKSVAKNALGVLTVLEKNSRGEPAVISVVGEESFKKLNPVLVTWDYQQQKFLVV
ncbi:hypothetical protein K2X40_00360 [Candidatus Babeliales bacterium]|nr:hypothetical protein [Candidatus Babeliales bacterium]